MKKDITSYTEKELYLLMANNEENYQIWDNFHTSAMHHEPPTVSELIAHCCNNYEFTIAQLQYLLTQIVD